MDHEHTLCIEPYRVAVYLNRIARGLREHAIHAKSPEAREIAADAARELEDMVFYATRRDPNENDFHIVGDFLPDVMEHYAWRRRMELEVKTNPDALIDWVRFGFPNEKAVG